MCIHTCTEHIRGLHALQKVLTHIILCRLHRSAIFTSQDGDHSVRSTEWSPRWLAKMRPARVNTLLVVNFLPDYGLFYLKINSLQQNPNFWRPWRRRLWKTLWEKEKILATSIFSFTHHVFFTLPKTEIIISVTLSSANAFNLVQSEILSFGKELSKIVWLNKCYGSCIWGFNTTLRAKVKSLLFPHASEETGENMPQRNFASTGYQTHNHQIMRPTCYGPIY